jgi:hypothetical protein
MTTLSLRQLVLNNEPPSRRELCILTVTLYAIVFAVLACNAISYFAGADLKSSTPSTQSRPRARFA